MMSVSSRKTGPSPAAPTAAEFAALVADFRERLDRRLVSWLEGKRRDVARYAPDAVDLVDALSELVMSGGKRLRPALVHYTYRAGGGSDLQPVTWMAVAVEFLHTYLLVHDDIMDHAETRRGRPAAHVRFREMHRAHRWRGSAPEYGQAVAILVGDLSHAYAVEAFGRAIAGTPRAAALRRVFFRMSEEVIAGQHLELRLAVNRVAGEEDLARVLRLKSGRYTVERPMQLGAILAGASGNTRSDLARYGAAVGEAFQLQDDILGMFGDADSTGKPVGSDLAEGKFTFLIFHALRHARPEQARIIEHSLGSPGAGAAEVEKVREILRDSGALERVRAMVDERLGIARRVLEDLELRPEGRAFLEGLIGFLAEREQ